MSGLDGSSERDDGCSVKSAGLDRPATPKSSRSASRSASTSGGSTRRSASSTALTPATARRVAGSAGLAGPGARGTFLPIPPLNGFALLGAFALGAALPGEAGRWAVGALAALAAVGAVGAAACAVAGGRGGLPSVAEASPGDSHGRVRSRDVQNVSFRMMRQSALLSRKEPMVKFPNRAQTKADEHCGRVCRFFSGSSRLGKGFVGLVLSPG